LDLRELKKIGPYAVRRYVAEGGMAWVFEVADPRFPKARRALKMLKPEAAHGTELELFHQEEQRLAEVDHPNVITIFDEGRDPTTGCYYYTMNYIEGPSLAQYVEEHGPLEARKACEIVMGALAGLQQIHERNIVHRDIKPGNILVAPPDDRAVVMDLGIAREAPDEELTQHTTVIRGTPLYMSPEQSGGKRVHKASDIFSLGLTLYHCLTRQTVYHDTPGVDARNPQSVRDYIGYLAVSSGELEIHLPRSVPRAVEAVIRKACRRDPRERYQDAGEMREALKAAVETRDRSPWPGRLAAAGVLVVLAALGVRYGAEPLREAISGSPPGREAPGEPAPPGPDSLAQAAREQAAAARSDAQQEALDTEAYRASVAKAQRWFAAGEEQLATGASDAARESFQRASAAFRQLAFLGPAGESEKRARALLATAEQRRVDPGRASVLIARAGNDLRIGNFEEARASFDQAISELDQTLAEQNKGPELVARNPADAALEVRRSEAVHLKVEARDLDGDELRYTWTVNGEPHGVEGPALQLSSLEDDTRVEVRVADPLGAELKESWDIAVVNAKPRLQLSPGGNVKLSPGDRQSFTARADDPDGDTVTTEFLLDGRKVAAGERYDFQAEQEGTFTLLVRATDAQGARVTGKRTITVAALQTAREAVVEAPEPPVRQDTGSPPASPLETLVEEYEQALASCNSTRLRQVLRMTPKEIKSYEDICKIGPIHATTALAGRGGESGERGWICFDIDSYFESGGSRTPLWKGTYQGNALKRSDGWQFTRIVRGCQGG
jgi:serine/threonine-protein kinase